MAIRNQEKYDCAYILFMESKSQKEICERVKTTPATLQKWRQQGEWDKKRSAKAVSFDEIITKTLAKANEMLGSKDFNADAFAKTISQLKALKGEITINDKMLVCMAFGDWLIERMSSDRNVDNDFVRKVTKYQDLYLIQKRDGN